MREAASRWLLRVGLQQLTSLSPPSRNLNCPCRDASGAYVAEGTPGATAERVNASEVEPAGGGGYVLKADPSVKVRRCVYACASLARHHSGSGLLLLLSTLGSS